MYGANNNEQMTTVFPGKFDYSDKDIQEIVASLNIFPGNLHFLKPWIWQWMTIEQIIHMS